MCAIKSMGETTIQVRTSRWGSFPTSEPVMYQLGLKPAPQVPPRTMVRMRGDGEMICAPACKPQMSLLQLSRSPSLGAVLKAPRRSSDPRQ